MNTPPPFPFFGIGSTTPPLLSTTPAPATTMPSFSGLANLSKKLSQIAVTKKRRGYGLVRRKSSVKLKRRTSPFKLSRSFLPKPVPQPCPKLNLSGLANALKPRPSTDVLPLPDLSWFSLPDVSLPKESPEPAPLLDLSSFTLPDISWSRPVLTTTFQCPHCGKNFDVENAAEGQPAICWSCLNVVTLTLIKRDSTQDSPGWTFLKSVGKIALAVGAAFALFKIGQAIFDEDYGTRSYPPRVRRTMIEQHLASHGSYCFDCSRRVPHASLTIDHRRAWANGGRTSWFNARVICLSCNSSKGARDTILDSLIGC